jgi:hypothetical protein
MKNNRTVSVGWKHLALPDDGITTLQIQSPRVVSEDFGVSDNDRATDSPYFFFGDRFQHNFRANTRRIAHSYADARLRFG